MSQDVEKIISYYQQGKFAEAGNLALDYTRSFPGHVFGWKALGTISVQMNRGAQAIPCLQQALKITPRDEELHNALGRALHMLGNTTRAISSLEQALSLKPDYTQAMNNLGMALSDSGQLEESIGWYKKALGLKPDYAEAWLNLGNVHQKQENKSEALRCYQQALKLRPDFAQAYNNQGNILRDMGQDQEALESYHKALNIAPDYADALSNLGNLLRKLGKHEQALSVFNKALKSNPGLAQGYCNRGNLFKDMQQPEAALKDYNQALELNPELADGYFNRGALLVQLGFLDQALNDFEKTLAINPGNIKAFDILLFFLNCHPDMSTQDVFARHREYGQSLTSAYAPRKYLSKAGQKLRIGYVSADFNLHSVAWFIRPVLDNHDPEKFEIFCYYNSDKEDQITREIQSMNLTWRNIHRLSHDQTMQQVLQDKIDILIDLSGHTYGNRLPLFAKRAAPVQVTYLGYPNTTGLQSMDWRIVDAVTDPPGMTERYNTEQLYRLPGCFLCYRPGNDVPEAGSLPLHNNGFVTFGSFNDLVKISKDTIALWAQVLNAVPGSKFILKGRYLNDPYALNIWQKRFSKAGIDLDRVNFVPSGGDTKEHLSWYNRVDIALDTYPYHGTTTTCEALYMGVPVITMTGDRHVSRVGTSILNSLNLGELTAGSEQLYIEKARRLAADQVRLSELHTSLRGLMKQDEKKFVLGLEQAYMHMWES
ncbi:tetratricopeptide repeat protein [Desulfonatronovibrio magnus]|uniref:tetratricopeptide repeat protein n=1 Tax=Desulfonatronovibrio magnus TaxID=698827 RepID=UPI000695E3ED|nr:tetratricopeptide repeat protein [Desulfonatronovibrio magnus]